VKLYTRPTPIFDEFNITSELEKALRPKVWLKSGGYIVINQTEALVAIDINTGKYVGKSNRLEDTIVKTNTDAIKEIVRQIRLRDLGGIIVVDFIDMDERKNRQKVMQALEEAMRADRAPNKILQFNDFGLVAITRKRVKQSLERTLCVPCSYCEGAGYVKSPQTLVGEILQEAHKIARAVEGKDVLLRVSPEVARLLKSNQNTYLQELEEILGRAVIVKSDPLLHQEKFDLA
jgi:ribonuclease G